MFIVLSSCLLYLILVIIYIKYIEIKYTKNLNVLNQNVNITKRARFATFAKSIVDNCFCLLQQYNWNTIKIRLPQLINALYGSNFMTILDFFISRCKNWPWLRGFLTGAVAERFKQESVWALRRDKRGGN